MQAAARAGRPGGVSEAEGVCTDGRRPEGLKSAAHTAGHSQDPRAPGSLQPWHLDATPGSNKVRLERGADAFCRLVEWESDIEVTLR